MPKLSHEALVHLVRAAPQAIVALVSRALAIELPLQVAPRVTAAELVDLNLAEYRADAVITLGPAEQPDEALVVEAPASAARGRSTSQACGPASTAR